MGFESFPTLENQNEKPNLSLLNEKIEQDKKAVESLVEEVKKATLDPEMLEKLKGQLKVAWEQYSQDNKTLKETEAEQSLPLEGGKVVNMEVDKEERKAA